MERVGAAVPGRLALIDETEALEHGERRCVLQPRHCSDTFAPGGERRLKHRAGRLGRVAEPSVVFADDAAEVELATAVDLLPLHAGQACSAPARADDDRPEAHAAVPLEALDLLLDPVGGLAHLG